MGSRDVVNRLVERIGDVGVPVTADPLAAVPPCVLVGTPDGTGPATMQRGWSVTIPVFVIGPRSWDRFDVGRLLDVLDLVVVRLRAVAWSWQPYASSPDLTLPAVRVTVTGTLTLEAAP